MLLRRHCTYKFHTHYMQASPLKNPSHRHTHTHCLIPLRPLLLPCLGNLCRSGRRSCVLPTPSLGSSNGDRGQEGAVTGNASATLLTGLTACKAYVIVIT